MDPNIHEQETDHGATGSGRKRAPGGPVEGAGQKRTPGGPVDDIRYAIQNRRLCFSAFCGFSGSIA
jgi:hypothetical protein